METISLNIESDTKSAKVNCDIPKNDNLYSMNCITENSDLSGDFKVSDDVDLENDLPKINIVSLSYKSLHIEKKQENKKLSKGAKIGIIIGVIAVIVICVTIIILYKTGVLFKGSLHAKTEGYNIAPDKSRNVTPWENNKNSQFDAIKIQNQNVNLEK